MQRADPPTARPSKPTGHHEWQPPALLRTSCDIRSSVILPPGSRDSFVQSSSSFQTESSSTCSCAWRVKPDCRMPDETLRMGSAWSMVEWLIGYVSTFLEHPLDCVIISIPWRLLCIGLGEGNMAMPGLSCAGQPATLLSHAHQNAITIQPHLSIVNP